MRTFHRVSLALFLALALLSPLSAIGYRLSAIVSAAPLGPDGASNVHRFPRPAGAAWSSSSVCYDAVQPDAREDGAGALWWLCFTKGPRGTGQYVVRSDEQGSALVDVGFVPTARGALALRQGKLVLVFHDLGGPGWVEVPGWVVPDVYLEGRAALPLVGRGP